MKLLAIGDRFIPVEVMEKGLKKLEEKGVIVDVKEWKHNSLEELQKYNLLVEQKGPEAVELPAYLLENVDEYDIIVVQFTPVSKKLIDKAKSLKVICALRGGVENIACDYAAAKNISVLNTPGRNARAVAEFAIGMILSEIRNIARSNIALNKGEWRKDYPNSGEISELYNKTIGIVGFGHIGQLVAGYLQAFGSNIIAYDPYFKGEYEGVKIVSLEELMKNADLVTVHARLTDDTYHLIGEKEINLMKKNAVLVNTARSGLVDEQALIKALEDKKIMGAALDVFDVEPIPTQDEILKLDNITLTPHLAGSTKDAFINSPVMMRDILIRALSKDKKLPVVNNVYPSI